MIGFVLKKRVLKQMLVTRFGWWFSYTFLLCLDSLLGVTSPLIFFQRLENDQAVGFAFLGDLFNVGPADWHFRLSIFAGFFCNSQLLRDGFLLLFPEFEGC